MPSMKHIKKPTGVSLDSDLLSWLDARAEQEHTSRSEIIRKAVLMLRRAELEREACNAQ